MTRYITNGVLRGLHDHKAGQYRSLQTVTCISLALLIRVIITCLAQMGDGGLTPDKDYRVIDTPRFLGAFSGPPSSPLYFVQGDFGQARIVSDHGAIFTPNLPESVRVPNLSAAPGVFDSRHQVDGLSNPSWLDADFGLPDPPPLWRFTSRGLPSGIDRGNINLLNRTGHAVLRNPLWPSGVWLRYDTAIVEGYLTLHSNGLLSFELLSESHARAGFATAVHHAVNRSSCIPALDNLGNRISVRCRYRCLFFQGGQPSMSVDGSITARIRED